MATPLRNVRVEEDLWSAAQEVAAARGESVSDVVRAALARYVARHMPKVEEGSR